MKTPDGKDTNVLSKTPEEIKKGLECCSIDPYHCGMNCPYVMDCHGIGSVKTLEKDALAYIQQLEEALLLMVYQYCCEDDGCVSHRWMTAGEHAFAALGIENYCSIETISKRLDEMEGIHKTPPAASTEGGINMGYRHYFYLADKKHCEAVKHLTPSLFNAYCSMHFPQSVEDYGDEDKYIDFMETLGQKRIFEFGKLYFDDTAERIYAKGVPLFQNDELRDYYSDYNPAIVGKEAIKEAIEIYRCKIINYYKGLIKNGATMKLPPFGIEIKRADIDSTEKVCRHIEDELRWWEKGALNLDEDKPRLTDSWLYEHTIFDLVRLYKSIDWDKHCVLFYGW